MKAILLPIVMMSFLAPVYAEATDMHLICDGSYVDHMPNPESKPYQYTIDISGDDVDINWMDSKLQVFESTENRIIAGGIRKTPYVYLYSELSLNRYSGEGKLMEYTSANKVVAERGIFKHVSGIDFTYMTTHTMKCKKSSKLF